YDFPIHIQTILESYAKNIGMLFQAVDDYLDIAVDIDTGKTHGIDQQNNKITYLTYMTPEELLIYIKSLQEECLAALQLLKIEGCYIMELEKILTTIVRIEV